MRLRAVLQTVALGIAVAFAGAFETAAGDEYPAEIVPQLGHSATVLSVAISPDGKRALSGSSDKTVRLWDLSTGREIRKFEGHSATVLSVAISPDGKTALSGGGNPGYFGEMRYYGANSPYMVKEVSTQQS